MTGQRARETAQAGVLFLLAAVLVGVAYARIHTVVTGFIDVVHYYDSARAILEAPTWPARLRALFEWAPVFPALLALVLRWAGPAGVYFINPPVVVLLLFGMGCWTWRALRDYAAGVLTLLAAAILFLTAFGRISVYMLYPFREPLSFLFIFWGMGAALEAGRSEGRRAVAFWGVSGVAYVLAAAVREPSIFALLGAIGFALAQTRLPWGRRWRHVAVLTSPFWAGLVLLGALSLVTGVVGTSQFSGWRSMTAGLTLDAWRDILFRHVQWWWLMCGWPGLLLAGLGWAGMLRAKETAWWLLVPPMLATLFFYAGFAVSSRYALASAIYLVPLAGIGIRLAVRGAARVLARGRPGVERAVLAALACALAVYSLRGGIQVDSGERVGRREMDDFGMELEAYAGPDGLVATEPRARHLVDALAAQLDHPQPELQRFFAAVAQRGEGYFLKPLTAGSLSAAKVPFPQISFEERIRRQMDVEPVLDDQLQPVTMTLGPGTYGLHRVTPWSNRVVGVELRSTQVAGGMFWLDFRASDPAAARRVRRLDAAGRGVQSWELSSGNGLIPFALDAPVARDVPTRLHVESSAPLPASLLARPADASGKRSFSLGPGRLASAMEWIVPPTQRGGLGDRWGALVGREGAVSLPRPVGWNQGVCRWSFEFETTRPREALAVFRYGIGERELGSVSQRLTRRKFRHEVAIDASETSDPLAIWIQVAGNGLENSHFRLTSIGGRLEPSPP